MRKPTQNSSKASFEVEKKTFEKVLINIPPSSWNLLFNYINHIQMSVTWKESINLSFPVWISTSFKTRETQYNPWSSTWIPTHSTNLIGALIEVFTYNTSEIRFESSKSLKYLTKKSTQVPRISRFVCREMTRKTCWDFILVFQTNPAF